MTDDPRILLAIDGLVATITLNRPAKLNAIDEQMLVELEGALYRLERESALRAVILSGAGKAFSVEARKQAYRKVEDYYGGELDHGLNWMVQNNPGTRLKPRLTGALDL